MIRFILLLALCLLGAPAFAQTTYTLDIHNAPGWHTSTNYPISGQYTNKMRVLSGPGYTPATNTYNNGQPLAAYELTSGACTSAGSGAGPAGAGIPSTSGSITDGSCTWKYVSKVDYISFTGWAFDNGTAWTSGANYYYYQMVHTGANAAVYQQAKAGCHSTVQPTAIGTAGNPESPVSTADGCAWFYRGQIGYTSNAHPMPMSAFDHDTFTGSISGTTLTVTTPPTTFALSAAPGNILNAPGMVAGTKITGGSGTTWTLNNAQTLPNQQMFNSTTAHQSIQYAALYVAELWNDREYLNGTNGENTPITLCCHNWTYNDSGTITNGMTVSSGGSVYGYPITIKAAPNESFEDTLAANPSIPLAGYNVANGVGIRGTGGGVGLFFNDNVVDIHGLQIKSDSGDHTVTMNPGRACNMCVFEHSIFENGSSASITVLECGAQCHMYSDLFVAHGFSGIMFDYGGHLYNSTIVCPSSTCTVGVYDTWTSNYTLYGTVMSGNAIFGFTHLIATLSSDPIGVCHWDCSIWQGTGNATDVAPTDGNRYPAVSISPGPRATWYVQNFQPGRPECASSVNPGNGVTTPGVCAIANSVSASAAFVTWPGNYRIGPSSPLYGNGSGPYGTFNRCGEFGPRSGLPSGGTGYAGCFVQPDTPDILGVARPQSGRYDVGAIGRSGARASPDRHR